VVNFLHKQTSEPKLGGLSAFILVRMYLLPRIRIQKLVPTRLQGEIERSIIRVI